jgi:hypothetical protein
MELCGAMFGAGSTSWSTGESCTSTKLPGKCRDVPHAAHHCRQGSAGAVFRPTLTLELAMRCSFAAGNGSTAGAAVGGHAYSADGRDWRYASGAAYTTTLINSTGGRHALYRRERPKPVFSRAGALVALWNGAWSVSVPLIAPALANCIFPSQQRVGCSVLTDVAVGLQAVPRRRPGG